MKCPLCSCEKTQANPILSELVPYVQCADCGLMYQPRFVPKRYEGPHELPGDQMSEADKKVNDGLAAWLSSYVPSCGAVLDIGAKYPYLMLALGLQRPDCFAEAIDGIDEIEKFGEELGVNVRKLDVETEALPEELKDQDLVTLVHCAEHFRDPLATLRNIVTLLNPRGSLFIRSPLHDVKGIERDFTPGHYEIHPIVFCTKAVRKLAELLDMHIVHESVIDGAGQGDFILRKNFPTDKWNIGVGMIVKNEERDLPAALESVATFADVICILDTGSTDGTARVIWDFFDKHPRIRSIVQQFTGASEQDASGEWRIIDFSKARNRYVDRLERAGCDYIFSLDADDVIENPQAVRDCLKTNQDAYDFQIVDNLERPSTQFSHMRLWRAGIGIRFEGPCHEYPTKPKSGLHAASGLRILHRWDQHTNVEPSTSRNLRILKRAYENGDKSSRTLFYLANSYRDCQQWKEAIAVYREYLKPGNGWHDERVYAWVYLARCLRFSGQIADAIAAAHSGLAEDDRFSELHMELVYTYSILGSENLVHYARLALQPTPPTVLFLETNKYTDQPWRMMAAFFEGQRKFEEAAQAYREVLKFVPDDADMIDALDRVKFFISKPETLRPKDAPVRHFCRPGAAGDILCALAAVQQWSDKNPGERVIFHCHEAYRDLVLGCLGSTAWGNLGATSDMSKIQQLIGYPIKEGYPDKPMQKHLIEYFAEEIGLSEVGMKVRFRLPRISLVPARRYVTVQVSAGWSPYKEWPIANWQEIVNRIVMDAGLHVVQIGGANDPPLENVGRDLGGSSWLESAALIANASLHLGIDSFGNHATMIEDVTTGKTCPKGIILWGSTSPIGSGYAKNVNIWRELDCSPCYREYPAMSKHPKPACPRSDGTWLNTSGHHCMGLISVGDVWREVKEALSL